MKYDRTSPGLDLIDSRDIEERRRELISERDSAESVAAWEDANPEAAEELNTLQDLCDEGESFADWKYGATLILDSYFIEYAQDLADSIGCKVSNEWPGRHIDWEAAAEELKRDYSEVIYAGYTYYLLTH